MEIVKLCGIALLTAFAAAILRREQPVFAVFLSIGGGLLLLGEAMRVLMQFAGEWQSIFGQESVFRYHGVLLRSLGIALSVEFAADICRDAGEDSTAGRLELAGKIAILILSLPLLKELLDLTGSLMK